MKSPGARTVCIVTPGYVATTPRVVKEADALAEAGYRVRVVFTEGDLDRLRAFDAGLLEGKSWQWTVVRWSRRLRPERVRFWRLTVPHQVLRRLPPGRLRRPALLAWAESRVYPALAGAAAAEAADLFIGHYPVGLVAAAGAAARWGARVGYDAEDLHVAEPPATVAGRRQADRIERIERTLLPRCAHRTAVSSGVAEALAARYGIRPPVAVHNAFALAEHAAAAGPLLDRRGPALSLHWFSQVIGLDRGLQDAIRAAGVLGGPVQIHLRGEIPDATRAALLGLAAQCGVAAGLRFHPPVPPGELVVRAAEHDIGLALEQPLNESRALSVTNKLFVYLAAGLAVAATDLPGQRGVLSTCPEAGRLYPPGDHRALAACLEDWRRDAARLRAAKAAALAAARVRWCWEVERQILVAEVDAALRPGAAGRTGGTLVRAGAA